MSAIYYLLVVCEIPILYKCNQNLCLLVFILSFFSVFQKFFLKSNKLFTIHIIIIFLLFTGIAACMGCWPTWFPENDSKTTESC